MRAALIAIFTAWLLAGCANNASLIVKTAKPVAVAPIALDPRGRPMINITVNGEGPYPFIVDTAASKTLVTERLAGALDLEVSETRSARVFSLNGVERHRTARLAALAIGAETITDAPILVVDDFDPGGATPARGVLGVDILSRYVFLMNPQAKQFALYPRGSRPDAVDRNWGKASLHKTNFGLKTSTLYTVAAQVSGRSLDALIDSGAEVTIGNLALVDHLTRRTLRLNQSATRVEGSEGRTAEAYEVRYRDFRTGGINWGGGSFFASDARIFEALGYADSPFALIGFDILGRRRFAIDFENQTIFVEPTP